MAILKELFLVVFTVLSVVSGAKLDHLHRQHHQEVKGRQNVPLELPQVPGSLADGPLAYDYDLPLWNHYLHKNPSSSLQEARTVVSVSSGTWLQMLPTDVSDPLFAQENSEVAIDYLRDSLSLDSINVNDPKLSTGVTLQTVSGKELVIKKSASGDFTINGEVVQEVTSLDDGTTVFTVTDFLFGNRRAVEGVLFTQFRSGTVQGTVSIPAVPNSLVGPDAREYELVKLWSAIRKGSPQPPSGTLTVVAVRNGAYWDLIPSGAGSNPLLRSENSQVTQDHVMDSLSTQPIDVNDPNLSAGVTIQTISGKDLVFTKLKNGLIKINGVTVTDIENLKDGVQVFQIDTFLFDNAVQIGRAVGGSPGRTALVLPPVSGFYDPTKPLASIVSLWQYRYEKGAQVAPPTSSGPKTVINISGRIWQRIIPADAANPLFDEQYSEVADNFVFDSLSFDEVNLDDPELRRGIVYKTISGKDLLFKDAVYDILTINGSPVDKTQTLSDGRQVFTVDEFLFGNEVPVGEVFRREFRASLPPPLYPLRSSSLPQVPQMPLSLRRVAPLVYIDIWDQQRFHSPHDSNIQPVPRTFVLSNNAMMDQFFSWGSSNILILLEHSDLATDFILDTASSETFNPDDTKLTSPTGVSIKSITGKDLLFKKDTVNGELSVNGVAADSYETLEDGTTVFYINGFLFDHDKQITFTKRRGFEGTFVREGLLLPPHHGFHFSKDEPYHILSLWQHRYHSGAKVAPHDAAGPKTMINTSKRFWGVALPDGFPDPLFDDKYSGVADLFIFDSLIFEEVNLDDPKLRRGIYYQTMSDEILLFKKMSDGTVTINGVPVSRIEELGTGRKIFTIDQLLADNESLVGDVLQATFGVNLRLPPNLSMLRSTTLPRVPIIPNPIRDTAPLAWVDIWDQQRRYSGNVYMQRGPKTLILSNNATMQQVLPQSSANILLEPQFVDLATSFVLDTVSGFELDLDDTSLTSPAGMSMKTMTGKDLLFKRDATTGKLSVNGVPVDRYEESEYRVISLYINGFLFNYDEKISSALSHLHRGKTSLVRNALVLPSTEGFHDPTREPYPIVSLWQHRYERGAELSPPSTTDPKTVINLSSSVWQRILPTDVANPLFHDQYSEEAENLIYDSLSLEEVDLDDPELRRGVSYKTISGKDLLFKKAADGSLTINGAPVTDTIKLLGGRQIFTIEQFLFDNEAPVYDAIRRRFGLMPNLPPVLDISRTSNLSPVPPMPYALRRIAPLAYVDIWDKQSQFPSLSLNANTQPGPKLVVLANDKNTETVIPSNQPNALLAPEYDEFAHEFILDSISQDSIDLDDPRIEIHKGIDLKLHSGKSLRFRKHRRTGEVTMNTFPIERFETLDDGTQVIYINGFLFTYFRDIGYARDAIAAGEPHEKLKATGLPQIPASVAENPESTLGGIWEHRLEKSATSPTTRSNENVAKVVIETSIGTWFRFLPLDLGHPLYHEPNSAAADLYILDSTSGDELDLSDPQLRTPSGKTIRTFGGQELSIRKTGDGKYTLNGVKASSAKTLADGTIVFKIHDFLFDLEPRMREATQLFVRGGTHEPFDPASTVDLPEVPRSLGENPESTLGGIWKYRLAQSPATRSNQKVARVVFETSFGAWSRFLPFDIGHPLYHELNKAIAHEYIIDSISGDELDLNDRQMKRLSGKIIQTFGGKDVAIRRTKDGTYTVNGVRASSAETLADGTIVFKLRDFLFDLEPRLREATKLFLREGSHEPFDPAPEIAVEPNSRTRTVRGSSHTLATSGVRSASEHGASQVTDDLPELPKSFGQNPESTLGGIWKYRLDQSTRSAAIRSNQNVATVVFETSFGAWSKFLPFDVGHPLYHELNRATAEEYILDSTSGDELDLNDPQMRRPSGKIIQTFGGKDLAIRKTRDGKYTVNGVQASSAETLADGTIVFTLDDFLFDLEQQLREATELFLREGSHQPFPSAPRTGVDPSFPPRAVHRTSQTVSTSGVKATSQQSGQ